MMATCDIIITCNCMLTARENSKKSLKLTENVYIISLIQKYSFNIIINDFNFDLVFLTILIKAKRNRKIKIFVFCFCTSKTKKQKQKKNILTICSENP